MDKAQRKILRSPSVKRKSKVLPIGQRLTLERVLGLTVSSNASLSCDPVNGTIAYPAGCVVVLFNPRRNRQSHIFNVSKKTITSVAFSGDGKHLVTGECGHQPAVRVWDVEEKTQVAEFHGHKFGINCVAFSPNLKYIVSIGSQHDMMVNVWNWRTGNKVASNKVSSKVCAVAFAADSAGFVTVGNRHVKFWYLDTSKSKINQTLPLQGRSGILGDQKNNFFCDVACGRGPASGSTFVITQSGLLCEFNEKRLLDKWVELRTKSANCLTVGEDHIYVGCAEGVVRVFSASSLTFVTTLPHPHHLGVEVATATTSSDMICTKTDAKYPDTVAIAVDDDHKKVACIYNDHSLYVWDVLNVRRVGKAWSFLYHSGCIWAIEVYPQLENQQTGPLPPGSFITASSDDTIRVWNLEPQMTETPNYKRNIYSSELLKVVYTDPSLAFLCDVNYNPAGATDKTDTTWDGKNGVRSIRVSPDGEHLASGDRQGNIRIYDIHQMEEIRSIEAHESDVVCLEYSFSKAGPRILASGSRDRLIHVFDVEQRYGLLQTLDDHSAAIQSVRFSDANNKLRMLSCGSDKSLLFRNAALNPGFEFSLDQHLVSKATMYDMIIDPTQKFVATACQDRNIRVYNMATGKQKKNYRGSVGDEGILLRVQLDPSGTYAATSCSDKNLSVLEFYTGELTGSVYGHSEMATGLRFTNDLKHLISVSADGCIFVWRLPSDMTKTMRSRMEELGKMPQEECITSDLRREAALMPNPVSLDHTFHSQQHFPVMKENLSPGRILAAMDPPTSRSSPSFHPTTPVGKGTLPNTAQPSPLDYRFSVGQLPNWAKNKFGGGTGDGTDGNPDTVQPKGRWAQRFDQNLAFKSQLDLTQIEDDTDHQRSYRQPGELQPTSSMPDLRRETVVLSQHLPTKNIPIIDDDDETNVDDDEDFFPAYLRSKLNGTPVESDRSSSDHDDRRRFRKSDPQGRRSDGAPSRRWGSRISLGNDKTNSFDLDDTDDIDSWSDTTEVIYPPSEPDSVDTYASTYKVFAVEGSNRQSGQKSKRVFAIGGDDVDSESTDPVSLEDQDEDDANDDTLITSTASTPSDERELMPPGTPDKELFVKENFESVSFTPVPMDKFSQQVATLERAAEIDPASMPFSPRLSLSSRFLSRSQFGGMRMAGGASSPQPDNWFDPLRKGKSEMARAMDETRRRLADMNWRTGGLIQESPEKEDPPSPPTKLDNKEPSYPPARVTQNAQGSPGVTSSPSPRTLRRFWADFTLPHQAIKEENPLPRIPVPQSLHHLKGDKGGTTNGSKIPLPSAPTARQATCSAELLPQSPTWSDCGVRPRPPMSPDLRSAQAHRLAQLSHDMKPVGLTTPPPASTPPQSPRLCRSRITSRPPRSPLSPDLRSPQSPRSPHSPVSPKPPPGPSSPRPPRSPHTSRTTRAPHSSDANAPNSPKPPRSPLSLRSSRAVSHSPDPKSARSPVPPKKPPRSLPPLKTGIASSRSCPQSPSSSAPPSPTPDGSRGVEASRQPPKKPPRLSLSLRARSSSPQSSGRSHPTSPSPPPHPDRSRGRESVRSCCRSQLAQAKGQTSEVATAAAGIHKDRDKSPVPPSPTRRVPASSTHTTPASPTHGSSSLTAREKRRSSSSSRQGEVNGTGNGTAPPVRQAPSYFRTTKSSRLKSASAGNLIKQAETQSRSNETKVESGAKKRLGKGRLSSSRLAMYASTPNLAGFQENDEETETEQTPAAPASNLRALADLSLSVPDINCLDDPTSTDSSSSSGHVPGDRKRSVQKVSTARSPGRLSLPPSNLLTTELHLAGDDQGSGLSLDNKDSHLMPPPATTNLPPRVTQSSLLRRAAQVRKRSTSELTLEQAKSILLGNSGILGANHTSPDDESPTSSPPGQSKLTDSTSSESSQRTLSSASSATVRPVSSRTRSASSHTNSTSSAVFEPDTVSGGDYPDSVYTPASTLAVAEEIERTATQLRRERERAAAAALGASRYDPPERDTSSRPKTPVRTGDVTSVTSGSGVVHLTLKDGKGKSVSPPDSANHSDEAPEVSVRDRIAQYSKTAPSRGSLDSGRSQSPLGMSPRSVRVSVSSPAPPDPRASPRSQSDTGLGSDTDTDSDLRQSHRARLNDTGSSGASPLRPDRSRLSLHLQTTSTASPGVSSVTVASSGNQELMQTCTSVLADLRMATQRAKDLHSQIQSSGTTVESRQQMMSMMSETFHETHLTLAQLALQSPVSDNPKPPSCPLVGEGAGTVDTAVMDKARDMLQPFVSYLSRELSDELIKLIRDRLEGNPQ